MAYDKQISSVFLLCFLPVTCRQVRSWFRTDSFQMSTGLRTEWSPVWTGPPRCVTALLQHLLISYCFLHAFTNDCHVSPQYPELLVASYNNNEDAPHEPDGVALVWNLKYKKGTPEYIFHCQVWTEDYRTTCFKNCLNTIELVVGRIQIVLLCSSSQR